MLTIALTDFDPAAIAQSGQCFRMEALPDGGARLIAQGRQLAICPAGEGRFDFTCTVQEFEQVWRPYFDLDTDYAQFRAKCKKRDDFLRGAMACGRGLRILRQDPWEMLICFIISQRKSIPAIRTAVEKLCSSFGAPLGEGEGYMFPTPQALAAASLEQLDACGLGYRAKYVADAAARAADGRLDLAAMAALPTPCLQEKLMEVFGVGVKVAQCVLLFGYHRLEAMPVDVWMDRVVQQVYGGTFPPSYQKCAGVLQQYLFCYARQQKLK